VSTPQGYNPVGQSAPGLPRHDGPLPGHVPGQYAPQADTAQPDANWSPNAGYQDPGFSPKFGLWSARIIMVCAIWITLPLQMGLYPVAGVVALVVGVVFYRVLGGPGASFDATMNLAWNAAFFALLPMMRVETRLEARWPAYRLLRHWLRLVLVAAGFFYFQVYQQGEPPVSAAIIAVLVGAIAHFVLRLNLARGLWERFQAMAWLRKE
jgi:hypothetical protein